MERAVLFLCGILLWGVLSAQTTVTKSWTGSLIIDNGSGNPPSVTFTSGVDFPANFVITSVSASVSFSKVDNTCASPGAGNPYNEEIRFILRGPSSLPTANRRLINFDEFTSTTNGGAVTMSFSNSTPLPTFPTTGTYASSQALTVYAGESPFGSWFIRGRDNFADDPLCYTGYSISITASSPLPVNLVEWKVEKDNRGNRLLSWATSSEINNDRFLIERSLDGRNWLPIHSQKGSGTVNTRKEYEFLDQTPLSESHYYRLTQIDFDGTLERFKILYVEQEEESYEGATPKLKVNRQPGNPDERLVELSYARQFENLMLVDIMGHIVREMPISESEKEAEIVLDLAGLPKGMYLLSGTVSEGRVVPQRILY
ncbi:hypothetical protein KFE98_17020 [bacterium SCSIO 12741]|nr:hypothetical protein KFE98_17020 [bacterium SCSIO 12741]